MVIMGALVLIMQVEIITMFKEDGVIEGMGMIIIDIKTITDNLVIDEVDF